MAVRTKQLVAKALASSPEVIYTCPDGETAIVKEVLVMHAGNISTFQLQLRSPANAVIGNLMYQALSSNAPIRTPMWLVMAPGQQLMAICDAGTISSVHVVVSGTELEGLAD